MLPLPDDTGQPPLKARDRLDRARRALASGVFTLVSWVLLGLLLATLVSELLKDKPDVKLVTALAAFILVSALFAQHGSAILPRVKKLGPVELFEESLPSLLSALDKVSVRLVIKDGKFVPGQLTPEELYHYREWDLYLSLFELWGMDPGKIKPKERYLDLLTYVASVAFVGNDWPRATARFERLFELSGWTYRELDVEYNIGLTYYHWGRESLERVERRDDYYRKSAANFERVIGRDKTHYLARYYLAYIHDDWGNDGLALKLNSEALEIRPKFAPARVNAAISYVRLTQLGKAYDMLAELKPGNEWIDLARAALSKPDDDLKALVTHPDWREKIATLVQNLSAGSGAGAGAG
jgi:tetratricopeptide (TPR) repeat protein